MGKHAYLIMAHNNFSILRKLIQLIDDKRNDIYLHIDKKVTDFNPQEFTQIPQKSNIYFVPRGKVNWGGFSQIECELTLLQEAVKEKYEYYHLISGVDLPLKTQDEIHAIFDENKGKEFVHFTDEPGLERCHIAERIQYYHIAQEHLKSKITVVRSISNRVRKYSLAIQKKFHVNRLKTCPLQIRFGANWFSITHAFACYVLQQKERIKKVFSCSSCADELFIQTLLYNSEFCSHLYYDKMDNSYLANLRAIDWERGQPYTYRIEDFDTLISSPYVFARKFDEKVDNEIVEKIYQYLRKKQVEK